MRRRLLRVAAAGALALGTTAATADTAMAHADRQGGVRNADSQPDTYVSKRDRAFLRSAAEGAYFEIAGGLLAATTAETPEVRALGAKLAADHTAELVTIYALAGAHGVSLPADMTAEQHDELTSVAGESGLDFDDEYTDLEVANHRHDIAAFKAEARRGHNDAVQAFAKKMIPELKEHLAAAKAANKAVEQRKHDTEGP